jgi:diaminopimelate decarboxylase
VSPRLVEEETSRYIEPARYTQGFSRKNSSLLCEQVNLEEIAASVGTPTYVYSSQNITAAYQGLDRALGGLPHTICYAVKANSNLAILRLLAELGSGFDVVSGGELYRLKRAGVAGERIVFSGVGKSRDEIREALKMDIRLFNIESEAELELICSESSRLKRRARASIRVNPDVVAGGHRHISTGHHRHKFGVDWKDARQLYLKNRDSRWIEWQGISAHLGSQILSLAPIQRGLRRIAAYFNELARAGIRLRYLDFGGGLGVRYSDEQPPSVTDYAKAIARLRPEGCHLLLEPGRLIVAQAGILLTRVLYTKTNRGKRFVIVDAAMNDFMRPTLYDAVHPITPVRCANGAAPSSTHASSVDVVGPVCETGDCFLSDWPMGNVAPGDLLVLWGAGAYGFVEASNYNSRPRPAEVLVKGGSFRVVRKRESRLDLIRGE